jgi:hypothetical protein
MAYVARDETNIHTTDLSNRCPWGGFVLDLEQRAWVADSAWLGLGFVRRCGSRILRGCSGERALRRAVF